VLVDSLISYAPSESENGPSMDGVVPGGGGGGGGGSGGSGGSGGGDDGGGSSSGSGIRAFHLVLFYGALAGEVLGKQVNFAWGFRLSGGHADRELARALLRGEKPALPAGGAGALRRWLTRPRSLLLLTALRALCAVPMLA
jgi:hypothetical protein